MEGENFSPNFSSVLPFSLTGSVSQSRVFVGGADVAAVENANFPIGVSTNERNNRTFRSVLSPPNDSFSLIQLAN